MAKTTPAAFSSVPLVDTDGIATAVVVDSNNVYVADKDNGIVVMSMSDTTAASPTLTTQSTIATIASALDIGVANNTVVIADGWNGVAFYDASSISSPVFKSRKKITNGYSASLAVKGSVVYASYDDEGIYAYDFSDPASPADVGNDNALDNVKHVSIAGTNVLVTYDDGVGGGGVIIKNADLSSTIGQITSFVGKQTVYDNSRYAYSLRGYGAGADSLYVIDLQNPSSPSLANTYSLTEAGGQAITVKDQRLYVVMNDTFASPAKKLLKIYSLSDPVNPTLISSTNIAESANDIALDGEFIYLAGGNVAIIHAGEINNPFAFGSMKVDYSANAIDLSEGHVFVADGSAGMTIHSKVTSP